MKCSLKHLLKSITSVFKLMLKHVENYKNDLFTLYAIIFS